MKKLDNYFWFLARKKKMTMELPFPDENPKFGNSGKALANRIAAHNFAGRVLKKDK